jgi:CRP-like cAMP-binding protein
MILIDELETCEFARKLGQPYLGRLAALARLKEVPEGTVLFEDGEDSPFFYVILDGYVSLEIEHPYTEEIIDVDTAVSGDLLGWSAVLGQHSMTATARSVSRCRLACFDVDKIKGLCEGDPSFGMAFFRQVGCVVSERLSHSRRSLGCARAISHWSPFALAHEGSD